MSSLHFYVRITNTNQVSYQLNNRINTFVSVVLSILLNASIFHLAKSPGNSCPNIDRADMILMQLLISKAYALGRYLHSLKFTICYYIPPIPSLHLLLCIFFQLSTKTVLTIFENSHLTSTNAP